MSMIPPAPIDKPMFTPEGTMTSDWSDWFIKLTQDLGQFFISLRTNQANNYLFYDLSRLTSLTTEERDSIEAPLVGSQIFNKTNNEIEYWPGTHWVTQHSGSDITADNIYTRYLRNIDGYPLIISVDNDVFVNVTAPYIWHFYGDVQVRAPYKLLLRNMQSDTTGEDLLISTLGAYVNCVHGLKTNVITTSTVSQDLDVDANGGRINFGDDISISSGKTLYTNYLYEQNGFLSESPIIDKDEGSGKFDFYIDRIYKKLTTPSDLEITNDSGNIYLAASGGIVYINDELDVSGAVIAGGKITVGSGFDLEADQINPSTPGSHMINMVNADLQREITYPVGWDVLVRRTINQAIPTSTFTTVVCNVEDRDYNNQFDTTTGVIVVSKTGTYQLSAYVLTDSGGAYGQALEIRVNGARKCRTSSTGVSWFAPGLNCFTQLDLTAGQVVSMAYYQNSGVNKNVIEGSLSMIYRGSL